MVLLASTSKLRITLPSSRSLTSVWKIGQLLLSVQGVWAVCLLLAASVDNAWDPGDCISEFGQLTPFSWTTWRLASLHSAGRLQTTAFSHSKDETFLLVILKLFFTCSFMVSSTHFNSIISTYFVSRLYYHVVAVFAFIHDIGTKV